MLFGAMINVYNDHKNLTFWTLSIERILWWRLYIDEFDVTLKYIKGIKNILADCFSRLLWINDSSISVEDELEINNDRKEKELLSILIL